MLALGSIGIYFIATNWTTLLPAQGIRNLGLALVGPGMLAWVARAAPPGHRAEYLGFFLLINSTLRSPGPLAGSFALELAGLHGLFLFAIATTVFSVVWMRVLYRGGEFGPSVVSVRTASVSEEG